MDKSQQTVRHRRLSAELKNLREAAGFTVDRVAREIGSNRTKVHRIERGEWKRLRESDLRKMADLYGVTDPEHVEAMVALARDANNKGWWARYSDVLGRGSYVSLESSAVSFRFYGGLTVPGLLQTASYAEAVVRSSGVSDDVEVQRRVEVRLERQKLLRSQQPPEVKAVVDEAALHRHVGGRLVLQEQISRLLLLSNESTDIRLLPFEAGAHMALTGQFVILEFAGEMPDPVVFIDISEDGLFLEEKSDLDEYMKMFTDVWERSLSREETQGRLAQILVGLTSRSQSAET